MFVIMFSGHRVIVCLLLCSRDTALLCVSYLIVFSRHGGLVIVFSRHGGLVIVFSRHCGLVIVFSSPDTMLLCVCYRVLMTPCYQCVIVFSEHHVIMFVIVFSGHHVIKCIVFQDWFLLILKSQGQDTVLCCV